LPLYTLSKDAENDLRQIAKYTIEKWGKGQLETYRSSLTAEFDKIGKSTVISKTYSTSLPDIKFVRAKEHFIFYVKSNNEKPIIIAVLHKSRGILEHLATRS
jgi:toxin ParE1/3/4